MVVCLIVGDRGDAATDPVFQLYGVWGLRPAYKREPLLQVVKSGTVGRDSVQKVAHRRIVRAVSHKHKMIQSRRIIDEVWYYASTKVDLAEIVVGNNDVGRCGLILG